MFKIINRYIVKEIAFPFIMTLLIFTFVLLIGKILQIVEMVVNKGISFIDVFQLILFIMPSFLMFTMPISFLIAVLIGLGRLSTDNEITVLRASGMSLYQLMAPITLAAALVAFITAGIGLLAPVSNSASKNLLFQILQQKASIGIKERIFNDDFRGLVLYADRISANGDYMEGILISDNRLTGEPATVVAQRGFLVSNPKSMTVTLRLMNGSVHVVDSKLEKYQKTDFSSYDINLDMKNGAQGGSISKRSVDMTLTELRTNILRQDLPPEQIRDMIIEFHKKLSIPVSCFIFGILAVPFALISKRSGKSQGFTIGLTIVAFYYTLQLSGEALGELGRIPPTLAVWMPNAVLGSIGLYLYFAAAGERSSRILKIFNWSGLIADRFKRRRS